jgi:hypothetical protein
MRACGLILSILLVPASSALAQAATSSFDVLHRELGRGDEISVVREGESLTGRLVRIGERDLDIRIAGPNGGRDVTILLNAIQSLERRRDSVRNGALIGAGIGAGLFGTMFIYAAAVDRNEMDEWAPGYLAGGAVIVGLGAVLGAAIDALHSKPPVRFDRGAPRAAKVRVVPVVSLRRGVGLAVGVRLNGG